MDNQIREKLKKMLNAPPDPPLKACREFLQIYCSDADSIESIRRAVVRMIKLNPRTVLAGLAGIEGVLAHTPAEKGILASIVSYDAGWVLDDPSDEGAKMWLRDLAQLLREELADKNLLSS